MDAFKNGVKLKRGMTLAFRDGTGELAGIPARVIDVWPRLPSGDYLVTLEYPSPIRMGHVLLQQIEAFASELYQPQPVPARASSHTSTMPAPLNRPSSREGARRSWGMED